MRLVGIGLGISHCPYQFVWPLITYLIQSYYYVLMVVRGGRPHGDETDTHNSEYYACS